MKEGTDVALRNKHRACEPNGLVGWPHSAFLHWTSHDHEGDPSDPPSTGGPHIPAARGKSRRRLLQRQTPSNGTSCDSLLCVIPKRFHPHCAPRSGGFGRQEIRLCSPRLGRATHGGTRPSDQNCELCTQRFVPIRQQAARSGNTVVRG
jgi:hypothetical protein